MIRHKFSWGTMPSWTQKEYQPQVLNIYWLCWIHRFLRNRWISMKLQFNPDLACSKINSVHHFNDITLNIKTRRLYLRFDDNNQYTFCIFQPHILPYRWDSNSMRNDIETVSYGCVVQNMPRMPMPWLLPYAYSIPAIKILYGRHTNTSM